MGVAFAGGGIWGSEGSHHSAPVREHPMAWEGPDRAVSYRSYTLNAHPKPRSDPCMAVPLLLYQLHVARMWGQKAQGSNLTASS